MPLRWPSLSRIEGLQHQGVASLGLESNGGPHAVSLPKSPRSTSGIHGVETAPDARAGQCCTGKPAEDDGPNACTAAARAAKSRPAAYDIMIQDACDLQRAQSTGEQPLARPLSWESGVGYCASRVCPRASLSASRADIGLRLPRLGLCLSLLQCAAGP